jgi:hypothetical protein
MGVKRSKIYTTDMEALLFWGFQGGKWLKNEIYMMN